LSSRNAAGGAPAAFKSSEKQTAKSEESEEIEESEESEESEAQIAYQPNNMALLRIDIQPTNSTT